MASIYKRKSKDGKSTVWRAIIRIKGYPTTCNTFERKQEADDWVKDTERRIKLGQYNFETNNTSHTYAALIGRLSLDGALQHHRSLKRLVVVELKLDSQMEIYLRWLLRKFVPNFLKRSLLDALPRYC